MDHIDLENNILVQHETDRPEKEKKSIFKRLFKKKK